MGKKLTYEYIKQYIENIEGYKLISSTYIDCRTKLEISCPQNHIFSMRFTNFQQGRRCPKCSIAESLKNKKTRKLNYYDVKNFIEEQGYILLSDSYERNNKKLKIKCPQNHEFDMSFANFQQGQRCPECYKINKGFDLRLSYEYVKNIIEETGYKLLSDTYESAHKKLKVMCPEGHVYDVKYANFYIGRRCPECVETKGEQKISNYLTSLNIKYISQYKQNNCRYKNPLEFDHYLPDFNTCIEYQGEQHYFPIDFAGKGQEWAESQFEINQKKDQIKRDYCNKNNIKLIEIPYWDFDRIEEILAQQLNLMGVIL